MLKTAMAKEKREKPVKLQINYYVSLVFLRPEMKFG